MARHSTRGASEVSSGRSATQRTFAEQPVALLADRALELVWDAAALNDDVGAYSSMPVGKPHTTPMHLHVPIESSKRPKS
jgi:hypothetical protein